MTAAPPVHEARSTWIVAWGLGLALVTFAYVGRAAISADDGAEILSETLGLFVNGRLGSAAVPPPGVDPLLPRTPHLHSRYGFFASLLPMPALAVAWPLRGVLGARGVDAVVALTWAAGALLSARGFLALARALAPGVSPLWMPAFLGGTYLWPYAADSYLEPFAAAGLAFSACSALRSPPSSRAPRMLVPAASWSVSCLLRPVLFTTAPVLLLAVLLAPREEAERRRDAFALAAWLAGFVALWMGANLALYGSLTDVGYGETALPFVHPLVDGILGSTVWPGRGLVFFAPIVLASFFAFRRLSVAARVLCFVTPALLLLIAPRWYVWHGGSCWGPRFLLPTLPLLAAPAVLMTRALVAPLLAAGFALNLPGVLVASGAFQSYAELLKPCASCEWPAPGGDRVSEVPVLSPLVGHAWLLATALGARVTPPWLAAGAVETSPRPEAAAFVSPLVVRKALSLPPIPPIVPRLLARSAFGYLSAGHPSEALRLAEASLELAPRQRDVSLLRDEARSRLAVAPGGR